jgi:hypothetical protein
VYAYIAFIAVFVVLYQAFIVLTYVRQGRLLSSESMKALRTIKYSAIIFVGFIAAAVAFLIIVMRDKNDIAGGVAMGLFLILVFTVVATASAMLERKLRSQAMPAQGH